jgi:hypothetical protein
MVIHEGQKGKQTSIWQCRTYCAYHWRIDHHVDYHQIRLKKHQSLILGTALLAIR